MDDAYTSFNKDDADALFPKKIDSASRKYSLNDFHGAIADLEITISIMPRYKNQYNLLGLCKSGLEDWEGAISGYDKALEIDSLYIPAIMNRGDSKAQLGLYEEAFLDYYMVTEIDSSLCMAWDRCGLTKISLNEFEESIKYFGKAIDLEPENPEYYLSRGVSRLHCGEMDGAKYDLVKSKKLGSLDASQILNDYF